MKVGEVYRFRTVLPSYTVEIIDLRGDDVVYKYTGVRNSPARVLEKNRWNDDFVLLTKLDRLLEGLDENIRISSSKTASTGKR